LQCNTISDVSAVAPSRAEAIDRVASTLLPRASLLTRLLLRSGPDRLSRTESALLAGLAVGPAGGSVSAVATDL
jgi:hypothetical protein